MEIKLSEYSEKAEQTKTRRNMFYSSRASNMQIDFSYEQMEQNETVDDVVGIKLSNFEEKMERAFQKK
jgi:hypothetical protein